MIKTKDIKIKIQNMEDFREEAREELKAIEAREQDSFKEDTLSFQSIDQMREFLTPKRLELLKTIKKEKPDSIYSLAKIVGRRTSNVNTDVNMLKEMGLLELEKTHDVREKAVPRVNYDRMILEISV